VGGNSAGNKSKGKQQRRSEKEGVRSIKAQFHQVVTAASEVNTSSCAVPKWEVKWLLLPLSAHTTRKLLLPIYTHLTLFGAPSVPHLGIRRFLFLPRRVRPLIAADSIVMYFIIMFIYVCVHNFTPLDSGQIRKMTGAYCVFHATASRPPKSTVGKLQVASLFICFTEDSWKHTRDRLLLVCNLTCG